MWGFLVFFLINDIISPLWSLHVGDILARLPIIGVKCFSVSFEDLFFLFFGQA